jgi:hypothetical protein
MPEGLIFGIVDNGVVGVFAVGALRLFKRLFPNWDGAAICGTLFGALFGNACSDWLGAMLDPGLRPMAGMIFLGCLIPIPIAFLWRKLNG